MRIKTEGAVRKQRRLFRWHRWFAWHPVEVSEGDWRWLEVVERSCEEKPYGHFGSPVYERRYRALRRG